MAQKLIIVESPAKARTISRLLGSGYVVESSIGHIRDLPSKTAEIPAAHRKKPWARIGVDIENGFKPLYIVPAEKKAQVKKLKDLLQSAELLYLATDEDREGEAIAWHLKEVLAPKIPVKRMVFHEITKRAVTQALDNPRDVDLQLVEAQEARRILDRLFGYEVSPVLWRKIRPRLSAGRVQSVATRLVVERERMRIAFNSGEYWSLSAGLAKNAAEGQKGRFSAELHHLNDRRIAVGRHFDPSSGTLSQQATKERVLQLNASSAEALKAALEGQPFEVVDLQCKPFTQKPHPPFITSTLQQEASRKLNFTAQRTMRVAQRLYESGYITYMRTDSTTLSDEAIAAARKTVTDRFGREFIPTEPRRYSKKVKGAQEAHEAIRPAGDAFRAPDSLGAELDDEALRLYTLVWKRTLASQMKNAEGERTQARLRAKVASPAPAEFQGDALFGASGKIISFAGYLRAYVEGSDDPEAELEDKERWLPALVIGEHVSPYELLAKGHQTQPPARYTEASLVRELEERGIGRPSTYAAIIQTIQDRGYVWRQGSALIPTLTAFAVVKLLEQYFEDLIDYDFTARMEAELDEIGVGVQEATPWLERFYHGHGVEKAMVQRSPDSDSSEKPSGLAKKGLKGLIGNGVEDIDARAVCTLEVGQTDAGSPIVARVGRYGDYLQIGDSELRASISSDTVLDELDEKEAERLLREAEMANRPLGVDPKTEKTVYIKTGSYGPYVQLGEPELTPKGNIKKGGRPKMASLWPSMSVETITLDQALQLLSYPKVLGKHPDNGCEIVAQDGRFGPYVQMELAGGKRDSRSLENHEMLATIDLPAAVALFAQPKQNRRRQANAQAPIATLAESPVTKKPIEVRTGRFGPYVTDGQVNATIPKGRDPAKITFDDALELIAAREQRMREQGKDPRPAKKPAAKKKATTRRTKRPAAKR